MCAGGVLRGRRRRRGHRRGSPTAIRSTAELHFALDTALISGYVCVTGGVASVFTPLYALPVVAAAGVQYRRGSVRIATVASVCFVGHRRLQYSVGPGTPCVDPGLPPADVAWVTVGINVFAFFAVAFLAGQLAENLRWADVAVEAASEKIADLEAFNRNVIDHLASGLADDGCRPAGVMTFNRAAAAITGWHRPRWPAGRRHDVLQLPEAFAAALSAEADAGQTRRADYTFLRPDGRPIELGVSAAPLPLERAASAA